MINNFELIEDELLPDSEDRFYHLQILRRGKDHPDLPAANRVIKAYFINGKDDLAKRRDEIIQLCEHFGARAYINLAPKSVEKMAKFALFNLSERIYTGDYKKIWKVFNTAAGSVPAIISKWVIDIDDNEITREELEHCINDFCDPKGEPKVYAQIPTKHGYHLITRPFNLQTFKTYYTNVDVHKNNPTILYIPKCLD